MCFVSPLPDPVVERVLELRIGLFEWIGVTLEQRHLEFYKDDRMHGKSEGWHKNGQKLYEHHYRDGKRHGKYEGWYPNGQKDYESHYRDDELHGPDVSWYADGQLEYECYFEDGVCRDQP